MWPALAAIAVPIITAVFTLLPKAGRRLHSQLKDDAAILVTLPDKSDAKAAVEELVVFEARALLARQTARLGRKLNSAYLALAIILAFFTAAVLYGLWLWVVAANGTPWIILAVAVLGLVGFFLVMLTAVGFAQIYKESTPKAKTSK